MIMNVNNPRDDEFIRWKWMIGMEVDDRDWIGLDWIGLDYDPSSSSGSRNRRIFRYWIATRVPSSLASRNKAVSGTHPSFAILGFGGCAGAFRD
jgi:hypothetical protein